MNPIKDIVIVGGGTAGLISALYLKHYFPNINVKIVKSSQIGIIGVGEGSTEHWAEFMEDIGIDYFELINETNATVKIGILFNDWSYSGSTYVHTVVPTNLPAISMQGDFEMYNKLVLNNVSNNPFILSPLFDSIFYKNKVPAGNLRISKQYHFDTFKLNSFLQNF